MLSAQSPRSLRLVARLALLFVFLVIQAGVPFSFSVDGAQAAPALEPDSAPVIDIGLLRPHAAIANLYNQKHRRKTNYG